MQAGMLKNVAIVAVAVIAFAYSQIAAHNTRNEMVAFYGLDEGEAGAYDTCQSALSDKELKNGGSKDEFCGCFAKKATGKLNASHKRDAGHVLNLIADKRLAELDTAVSPAAYEGLASSSMEVTFDIMGAFSTCNDEVTATCHKDDTACLDRIQDRLAKKMEFQERQAHLEASTPADATTQDTAGETEHLFSSADEAQQPEAADAPEVESSAAPLAQTAPETPVANDFGNLLPGGL